VITTNLQRSSERCLIDQNIFIEDMKMKKQTNNVQAKTLTFGKSGGSWNREQLQSLYDAMCHLRDHAMVPFCARNKRRGEYFINKVGLMLDNYDKPVTLRLPQYIASKIGQYTWELQA